MDQSDLLLLQAVPPYHLQALVKARRLPVSLKGQHINQPPDPSSMTMTEIAQYLFDPTSCIDALSGLPELEKAILHELRACGGRANSRDLALYFNCLYVPADDASGPDHRSSGLHYPEKSSGTKSHIRATTLQYLIHTAFLSRQYIVSYN